MNLDRTTTAVIQAIEAQMPVFGVESMDEARQAPSGEAWGK
jgi:hypothetical protein